MTFKLPSLAGFQAPKPRDWSDYQKAIFTETRDSPENLIVQACPGSGKTTTIVEAMNHVSGKTLAIAFQKTLAEELKSKVNGQEVRTINSLGHAQWRRYEPNAEFDASKLSRLLKRVMKPTLNKEFGWTTKNIIGMMKANAFGINGEVTNQQVIDLIESYQFDVPREFMLDIISAAHQGFYGSIEDTSSFDYDDQVYGPVYHGWSFPAYRNVFVDETQDLSPIQHIVVQMLAKSARIIAVGDRYQSIYGFRGALSNSMDALRSILHMKELPLSICYRCPRLIVEEAQVLVPETYPAPNAKDGEVKYSDADPGFFPSKDHFVLCRNNAPLFALALSHLRNRVPCQVRSNFLETIEGFIRRFDCITTHDLQRKLTEWYEQEVKLAEEKSFFGKLAALKDKYETLSIFAREYKLTIEVLGAIRQLAGSTSGATLSTVHRAKGLEAPHVYILRPDLMPSKYARTEEQVQQERNIQYVAITRAQESLTYGAMPEV